MRRQHSYPGKAGWKDPTVSRDNALANRVRFNRMQARVYELYRSGFTGTADDAAERLKISPFSARPRCSELVAMGLLEKLRVDRSILGRSAWVLGLAPAPAPAAQRELLGCNDDDGQPDEQQEWRDYDPEC